MLCSDSYGIFCYIFRYYKEGRSSTNFDSLSLPNGVAKGSFMLAENISFSVDDISRFFWEFSFEKFLHTNFPDEAESLAILAFCIREICLSSSFTNLRLGEMSNRENGVFELKRGETREEVGLVFI